MPDPVAVNSMFGRIARRYDLANRLLSGGADLWWRRVLTREVARTRPQSVLDLATGSGDVAFALARRLPSAVAITGMDFCQPMLDEAVAKQNRAGTYPNVSFRPGDGLALPEPDAVHDAVTIAFGLRNMADRARALGEMRRVLRPSGHLFLLEFSQPRRWFAPLYYAYLRHVLPHLARLLTGDKAAYDYLGGSIGDFPSHEAMGAELTAAGFDLVACHRLTCGIVALHIGRAPSA
jgi:demethylmenaquinone methyltransferase / 2-methoxy-6-polyprenyl-1,4-benzoquinol methylase